MEELIKEYKKMIYSVIHKYYNKYTNEYEDLYQIGCITIWKCLNSYNTDYTVKFSTFLYKSLINELFNYIESKYGLRSEQKKEFNSKMLYLDFSISEYGENENEFYCIIKDKKDFVEEFAVKEELEKALLTLKPIEKEVVFYTYILELKQREIAKILKFDRSYVSRVNKRALKKLKEELER